MVFLLDQLRPGFHAVDLRCAADARGGGCYPLETMVDPVVCSHTPFCVIISRLSALQRCIWRCFRPQQGECGIRRLPAGSGALDWGWRRRVTCVISVLLLCSHEKALVLALICQIQHELSTSPRISFNHAYCARSWFYLNLELNQNDSRL